MQTVSENGDLHEAELKIIHTVILLASADSYTIWCCRNSFNASLGSRMVFLFSQNNSAKLDWIKGANSDGINTETTLWCVFAGIEKTCRKSKKKRLFVSDFPLDHIHRVAIFLWDHGDQGGKICSHSQVLKRLWKSVGTLVHISRLNLINPTANVSFQPLPS